MASKVQVSKYLKENYVTVVVVLRSSNDDQPSSNTNLADTVHNNMDEFAKSMRQFFQYSCGGWLSNNPLGLASQNNRFYKSL